MPARGSREMEQMKAEIEHLSRELEIKEKDISTYVRENEDLKDIIKKIQDFETSTKKGKKIADIKKLIVKLEATENELREIKNKMGFLKKEKIQIQQELEDERKKQSNSKSHVIEIKEPHVPMQKLIKDLQEKLNKQKKIIDSLKQEKIEKTIKTDEEPKNKINTEESQEINELKQTIEKKIKDINELKEIIEQNEEQIRNLESQKTDTSSEKTKDELLIPQKDASSLSLLVKELQDKLNESKNKINTLQNQLKELYASRKEAEELENQISKLQTELKNKENKLEELQNQNNILEEKISSVDSSKFEKILAVKNKEIEDLTKETYLNKNTLVELQSQLNMKNQQISELQNKFMGQQTEFDGQQELRIRELRTIVETLKKQTKQQRMEISTLRKKIA